MSLNEYNVLEHRSARRIAYTSCALRHYRQPPYFDPNYLPSACDIIRRAKDNMKAWAFARYSPKFVGAVCISRGEVERREGMHAFLRQGTSPSQQGRQRTLIDRGNQANGEKGRYEERYFPYAISSALPSSQWSGVIWRLCTQCL